MRRSRSKRVGREKPTPAQVPGEQPVPFPSEDNNASGVAGWFTYSVRPLDRSSTPSPGLGHHQQVAQRGTLPEKGGGRQDATRPHVS